MTYSKRRCSPATTIDAWPLDVTSTRVLMSLDDPKHFHMSSPSGQAEWSAIVPQSGVVHLGPRHEPYTISMMHQLRCLDVLRDAIATKNGTSQASNLAAHCLNYMKQMVLCRQGLYLEPLPSITIPSPVGLYGLYECKNWGMVYREMGRNQQELLA